MTAQIIAKIVSTVYYGCSAAGGDMRHESVPLKSLLPKSLALNPLPLESLFQRLLAATECEGRVILSRRSCADYLLDYAGREIHLRLCEDRREATLSTVVCFGASGSGTKGAVKLAEFNAHHFFNGGLRLAGDADARRLFLSAGHSLASIERVGLLVCLDAFLEQAAECARWCARAFFHEIAQLLLSQTKTADAAPPT